MKRVQFTGNLCIPPMNRSVFKAPGLVALMLLLSMTVADAAAQCCAVGGGSPLAGDASQGVLRPGQMEISSYYQYVSSRRFLQGSSEEDNYLDRFSSGYLYSKVAYGLTDRLTMSIEAGYWTDKTQVGLRERDSYQSSGIGDLLLFPRYNIIQPSGRNKFMELTFGMGMKIPLGSYQDSIGHLEPFSGETIYTYKPLAVQASSGAQDFLFSLFYAGRLPATKLRLAANALFILKGWNPLGEKLGNYASLGIFAGYSFFEKLHANLQLKGEWIGSMTVNPDILMSSYPNYDPMATGSRKLFVSPQLSYAVIPGLMAFVQADYPVYQYVNKIQIASQSQYTFGLSLRFMALKLPATPVPVSKQ